MASRRADWVRGGGAVDFVGEDDLGDNGAGAELELAGLLVEEVHAGDVGRHEVGGELDATEGAGEGGGEGAGEGGFADTWDVFEEDMAAAGAAAGEEGGEGKLYGMLLADEDLGDVVLQAVGGLGDLVDHIRGDDSVHDKKLGITNRFFTAFRMTVGVGI